MKYGPLNPFAVRRELVDGVPLDIQVVAGATYVLAVRGDVTGATITASSFLGTPDNIEVIDTAAGGALFENFPTVTEGTFVTTGNWVRIERTGGVTPLVVSYIEAHSGGPK